MCEMRDDELLHADMLRSTWTWQDAKEREESTERGAADYAGRIQECDVLGYYNI